MNEITRPPVTHLPPVGQVLPSNQATVVRPVMTKEWKVVTDDLRAEHPHRGHPTRPDIIEATKLLLEDRTLLVPTYKDVQALKNYVNRFYHRQIVHTRRTPEGYVAWLGERGT